MQTHFRAPLAGRFRALAAVVLFEIAAAAAVIYGIDLILTHARVNGAATGQVVDGLPVYRLPPVEVVAHRSVELARIAREDERANARQAQTTAPRPPS